MSIANEIQRLQTAKTNIKSAIEQKGVTVGEGTIDTYADKIGEIVSGDYDKGYEDGKQAEYDTFWDNYQDYGNRTEYRNCFSGKGWNDETFKPKYDIKPVGTSQTYTIFTNSGITNLKKILADCGVVFDTSGISYALQLFSESDITIVGTLDMTGAGTLVVLYNANKLVSVDKIILNKTGTQKPTAQCFQGCGALTHCLFEGVIGASDWNFQWSPLDVESMKSIISCLKNYKGTDSEFVYTVKFSDDCKTLLEAEGITSPNGNTWIEYIEDLGWLC